jgi:hypothetical protein
LDNGIETIEDKDVRAQLRRQARLVYLKAILAGVALTLLCMMVPAR